MDRVSDACESARARGVCHRPGVGVGAPNLNFVTGGTRPLTLRAADERTAALAAAAAAAASAAAAAAAAAAATMEARLALTMSAAVDEAVANARAAMEANICSPSFASAAALHGARPPLHKRTQIQMSEHAAKPRASVALDHRPRRYSLEALPPTGSSAMGARRAGATHSAPAIGSRATRGHMTARELHKTVYHNETRRRPESARDRPSTMISALLQGQRSRQQPMPAVLPPSEYPGLRRQPLSNLLDSAVGATGSPPPEIKPQPHATAPLRPALQPITISDPPPVTAPSRVAPPLQPIDVSELPPTAKSDIDPQAMDYLVCKEAQRREVLELYKMYTNQDRYTGFGKLFEAHPRVKSTFESVLRLRFPRASRSDIAAMVAIAAPVAAKREWAKTMREVYAPRCVAIQQLTRMCRVAAEGSFRSTVCARRSRSCLDVSTPTATAGSTWSNCWLHARACRTCPRGGHFVSSSTVPTPMATASSTGTSLAVLPQRTICGHVLRRSWRTRRNTWACGSSWAASGCKPRGRCLVRVRAPRSRCARYGLSQAQRIETMVQGGRAMPMAISL